MTMTYDLRLKNSYDHVFRIFPIFFRFFLLHCVKCVVYVTFFTRKTPISENNSLMTPFFQFVLSRCPTNTTSLNFGGDGCMGRPHLKFWGGPSPQFPLNSIATTKIC